MQVWRPNESADGEEFLGRLFVHDDFITEATLHADDFFGLGIDPLRDELEVLKDVSGRITLPS